LEFLQLPAPFSRLFSVLRSPIHKPLTCVTHVVHVSPGHNASTTGTGANFNPGLVEEFAALNTQGVSHARLDFDIGGVLPLHTHPLAAETLFVLKGSVYTGFISDDNVLYASTLQVGDLTIFPKGTQHFQLNVGNETATTFNTLTSQNPGFLITANQLFETGIPSAVLEKSFGINAKTVKSIQGSVPRYWG
jgi:quercetin dioxygenase-like cupin family protein